MGLSTIGCQPAPAPAASPGASAAPPAQEDNWKLLLLPGTHYGRSFEQIADDGTIYAGISRRRFADRKGEIEIGRMFPAHDFVSASHNERGWYFLTEDGAVYHASSFVGDLSRIEGQTTGCRRLRAGAKAAYCIDANHVLWRAPAGTASFRETRPETFDVEEVGGAIIALDRHGKIHRSNDDGATFEPLPFEGHCVFDLSDFDDRVGVFTSEGPFVLADAGRWEPAQDLFEARQAAAEAARAKMPEVNRYFFQLSKRFTEIYPLARDNFTTRIDDTPPEGERSCRFRGEEDTRVADCGSYPSVIYRRSAGAWKRVGVTDRDSPVPLVTTTTGELVLVGSCDGESEEELRDEMRLPLCWFDGRDDRPLSWDARSVLGLGGGASTDDDPYRKRLADRVHLDTLWETYLLFRVDETHHLLDLRDPSTVLPVWPRPIGKILSGPLLREGIITAVVEHEGKRKLASRSADGPTRLLPLPHNVEHVAFVDEERWFAAGPTLADVHWSIDAGEHWHRAEVEVNGDPAAVPVTRPSCTATQCVAAPLLWYDPAALTEPSPQSARWIAPSKPLPPLPPYDRLSRPCMPPPT